jgi:hypothetical protein
MRSRAETPAGHGRRRCRGCAKEINGIKLIARRVDGVSGKDLAPLVEEMKQRLAAARCWC